MSPSDFFLFYLSFICYSVTSSTGEIGSKLLNGKGLYLKHDCKQEIFPGVSDKVNIELYYECLCGDCTGFDKNQFMPVVQKLNEFLNIKTYPYGNAKTIEQNGKYTFKCQHGPSECYGNKLHACALDIIKNHTQALLYNSCMMDGTQSDGNSDDTAADKCGSSMNIDSKSIKACANSEQGTILLKQYGDDSKKANFQFVPYVLVNGKEGDYNNFMKDVCAAFRNPPSPCAEFVQ